MNKKLIGFILIIVIAIVTISGCTGEQEETLIVFAKENLSFQYPETFVPIVFSHPSDPNYIVYEEYIEYEKDENIVVEIWESNSPLQELYYNGERMYQQNSNITNFTLENITIAGIPAVKSSVKYVPSYEKQYALRLFFPHNDNIYAISFWGNDLQSLESLYETVTQTIELN